MKQRSESGLDREASHVVAKMAECWAVAPVDVMAPGRCGQWVALCRMSCWWVLRRQGWGSEALGRWFGRTASGVRKGCIRIEQMARVDSVVFKHLHLGMLAVKQSGHNDASSTIGYVGGFGGIAGGIGVGDSKGFGERNLLDMAEVSG